MLKVNYHPFRPLLTCIILVPKTQGGLARILSSEEPRVREMKAPSCSLYLVPGVIAASWLNRAANTFPAQ